MSAHIKAISRSPTLSGAISLLVGAGLPAADLTDAHMSTFFYAGSADAPDAIVGVEIYGPDAMLRSLVVSPAQRDRGFGQALVTTAEQYAREHGVSTLYLLTTTAERFFLARGYSNLARDAAPPSIRHTTEFSGLCPASSAFLYKRF
jgi:amino-acid N-acetyltransferase